MRRRFFGQINVYCHVLQKNASQIAAIFRKFAPRFTCTVRFRPVVPAKFPSQRTTDNKQLTTTPVKYPHARPFFSISRLVSDSLCAAGAWVCHAAVLPG